MSRLGSKRACAKLKISPNRVGSLTLALVFIIVPAISALFSATAPLASANPGWWNASWTRRRPITITGTHPENYQIRIVIPYDNDMRADYGDLRFLENEASGVLSYWVENYTTDNVTVWVRRLENYDGTIYVYYGNPSAESESNGPATFELYDVTGLVGFWHFDEGSGTTVHDETNNNQGTVHGSAWVDGRYGEGLTFDGIDDYVNVPNSPSLSVSEYSVSLWVKNGPLLSNERVLITKGVDNLPYRISVLPDNMVKFSVQNAAHNFARVGSITLENGETNLGSSVIDPKGEFAYFSTATSPPRVVKVRLSDFTRVGGIILENGENHAVAAAIDPAGEFAYFGTWRRPGRVVKVRLSDFTLVDSITFEDGEDLLDTAAMDPKGEFVYFATHTAPAKIVKVRLSDFTRVGSLTLENDENYVISAVIDPNGEFIYFGTRQNPGRVVKVRLSDFTRVGSLTLPSGEGHLRSAAIDPRGEFAYFGTWGPVSVIKIRLGDFTRVGSITFPGVESGALDSAIIDPAGEFAYFGAWRGPGRVVKVRLSDFTRVGSVICENDENRLDPVVMDPKGEFAYYGTDVAPGRIVKVRLADFTTDNITSSSTLTGDFKHVTVTRDNSYMKIFVDGNLETSIAVTTPAPTNTEDLMIGSAGQWRGYNGRSGGFFSTAFNDAIDEVQIYNRTLTEEEVGIIAKNYTQKMGNIFNVRKFVYPEPTASVGGEEKLLPAPSLVSPENNENILDNTPTFEWTSVSDPSGVTYQIQIDNDDNFGSLAYFAVGLAENAHTLPDENALALGTYYWRVRAKDGEGNIGPWSEEWNFRVVPVGAIGVLLMPLLMLLPFALVLRRQNRRY